MSPLDSFSFTALVQISFLEVFRCSVFVSRIALFALVPHATFFDLEFSCTGFTTSVQIRLHKAMQIHKFYAFEYTYVEVWNASTACLLVFSSIIMNIFSTKESLCFNTGYDLFSFKISAKFANFFSTDLVVDHNFISNKNPRDSVFNITGYLPITVPDTFVSGTVIGR